LLFVLTRIYLLLLLVGASLSAPLPYALASALLLLLNLWSIFARSSPRMRILLTLLDIFLLALILRSTMSESISFTAWPEMTFHLFSTSFDWPDLGALLLNLPLILMVGPLLEENARREILKGIHKSRTITMPAVTLMSVCFTMILIGIMLPSLPLFFTVCLLLIYLATALGYALKITAGSALSVAPLKERMLSGNTHRIQLLVKANGPFRLYATFTPEPPWIEVTDRCIEISKTVKPVEIVFTPPLSGTASPAFHAVFSDLWGLVCSSTILQPLTLDVIPRSKYARHLAQRFLSGAGTGTAPEAILPLAASIRRSRGMEYLSSRDYQPGDRLKDIDFKHSLKLGHTISKDFSSTGGMACVLLANLSASSAEAADTITYNLICFALTLAYESIPTALALYNRSGVLEVTAVRNPRDILRRVLAITQDIDVITAVPRRLASPQIKSLRHNMDLLSQSSSPVASRLIELIKYQFNTFKLNAADHPATAALNRVLLKVKAPALVLLASEPDEDIEAWAVIYDRLLHSNFDVIIASERNYHGD
jgi:hypothetical protein